VKSNPRRSPIVASWAEKQVQSLVDDNMLRGSWAEHLVAHFLDISDRVPQWSYFDLIDSNGLRISVKQSVSTSPRFAVGRTVHAWSPTHGADGQWLPNGDENGYWCDAYVFAWLNQAQRDATLEEILDPDRWLFAALSRSEMIALFPGDVDHGVVAGQRTAGVNTLGRERFLEGTRLRSTLEALARGV